MMEIDDVVYGKIHLPPDVAAIIATPQFQRLKSIKQLGLMQLDNIREYTNNRYHHCIGTYHAAGKMLEALEKNTSWLSDNNNKIPLVYRQAVQIAALLHDIGHGPFSHTWERVVNNYEHEKIGFACVDEIFVSVDKQLFPELRANNNYGIRLIKALIQGKIKKLHTFQLELPNKFQFIFGIVSNERSKLDVDKWDYLKRDHFYLKDICNPNMDFDDVFLQAKVSQCGQCIEYRYEDFEKIYNLFAARWQFHLDCYQLPTNFIHDEIFKLAINETNPKINGLLVKAIDAEHNMQEFLQLTDDNVLRIIEDSPLSKFLKYRTKFREGVIENEVLQTNLYIPSVTSFVGCNNLEFYGDAKDKSKVIDRTETIKKVIKFYCDNTEQVVIYSVHRLE